MSYKAHDLLGREHLTFVGCETKGEGVEIEFPYEVFRKPPDQFMQQLSDRDRAWLTGPTPRGSWIINLDNLKAAFALTPEAWLTGIREVYPTNRDGDYVFMILPNA
jgi:hypothetical protein